MAQIITVDAGEKGRLLLDLWNRVGHHASSDSTADIEDASVVLYGGSDTGGLRTIESRLAGKIVIDCSNPADVGALRARSSAAEVLADTFPEARVVKAFNAITVDALAALARHNAPEVGTVYTSAFYCGDDEEAKRLTASLIAEANLDAIDCGPLANAVLLESLGVLGNYLGAHVLATSFAITVVRAPTDRSPLDRWM